MDNLLNWFTENGMSRQLAESLAWSILAVGIILVSYITYLIARKVIVSVISFIVRKSKTKWDDVLLEYKVFNRLSHIAPALVVYFGAFLFEGFEIYLERFAIVYLAFAGLSSFNAFLNAVGAIYNTYSMAKQRPIKGYIQVIKIVFFILVAIIGIATLMGQKPWALLTGFGAMTAVLMLVFKDSILGLIAGIQLSANDMVRLGDWIEMPKYGADGDVIDISLHTVKVQNWDKTISSIPAYSLISDSFKNWRGMSESGGRRIKRSIQIDMTSIKFCDNEMLKRFGNIQYISEYIASKKKEVETYNKSKNISDADLINGRQLTNIGTLRAYMASYLQNNPKIHKEMTFLIRQLPPEETGLPLEIYVFSNDQNWANYEAIQADIFDHFLAVTPLFDLRVFQSPTGYDMRHISLNSPN